MNELPTVTVDDQAAMSTFRELHDAIPESDQIVLIGGWAVKVRLAEYEGQARPTQDIDALLHSAARPARESLSEAGASQDDPNHSARLSGLPMSVDLLTAHPDSGQRPIPNGHDIPNVVTDPDQLHLAVPSMAHLLASCHSPIELQAQDGNTVTMQVAGPGALLVAKIATLGTEGRSQAKRYSDSDDVLRLLSTIPTSRLKQDFVLMTPAERETYGRIGSQLNVPQLARLATRSGHTLPPSRVEVLAIKYRNTMTQVQEPQL